MSDGTTAETLMDAAGNPQTVIVELPETTGSEAPPSDAVAIAEIEAERDVTIAAIHAETEQAHIEAANERAEQWHDNPTPDWAQFQALRETVETLASAVAALTPTMTQSTPSALEAEAEAIPIAEPTITLETPTEASSETRTEAPAESEDEKPVVVPVVGRAYLI